MALSSNLFCDFRFIQKTEWTVKFQSLMLKKKLFGSKMKLCVSIFNVKPQRKHLGSVLHELAGQKECKILEGHLMSDHVHMCISIPPKYSVSNVVGYIKGKSAISIARRFMGRSRNFGGESFWARGYFVSTVGLDEEMVKAYIRHQEKEDEHYDQLKLGM